MTSTTNYGLNIVEGTDVVNPLVQFNPNFTDIDSIMKANADASVAQATCVKSGTTHAVTTTNSAATLQRFTATGNWVVGDTMTIDGVAVSVFLPNGQAPQTDSFVINSEVIIAIKGSRVTLYVSNPGTASAVDYNNSSSGLSATNVQDAIDEIDNTIDNLSAASVAFDNTNTSFVSTDVQGVLDEVDDAITYTTPTLFTDTSADLSVDYREYVYGKLVWVVGTLTPLVNTGVGDIKSITLTHLNNLPIVDSVGNNMLTESVSDRTPKCRVVIKNTSTIELVGKATANRSGSIEFMYLRA